MFRGRKRKLPQLFIPEPYYHGSDDSGDNVHDADTETSTAQEDSQDEEHPEGEPALHEVQEEDHRQVERDRHEVQEGDHRQVEPDRHEVQEGDHRQVERDRHEDQEGDHRQVERDRHEDQEGDHRQVEPAHHEEQHEEHGNGVVQLVPLRDDDDGMQQEQLMHEGAYLREDDDEDDGEEEEDDLDYHEILNSLSKQWMNAEMDHTISQAASNELWKIAFDFIPKLVSARQLNGIRRKVPTFNHIRKQLHKKGTPDVQLEIGYRNRNTDEITLVNASTTPVSTFPANMYEKLYEVATAKVSYY